MLDTKKFLEAFEQLEGENGIAHEVTIQALKEAFEAIFKKKNYEDTRVEVDIIPEKGEINIYVIKKVVDDVLDDALEISLEDAQEIDPEIKVGDDCKIRNDIDDFSKADAIKFRSIFKQKIKEAEKAAIYAVYSDKAGELITGTVEKVEPKYTIVNIGRTSVNLPRSHMIGDETFKVGQTIKVYLSQVNSATGGPQIQVSRADSGFLKRLFEEEISEIFDGTVIIKSVSRKAGERSKVSVYSNDLTVDPIGACIGPAGTKIQKICSQLGKEKIDIVQYHEYPGAFIAEALKPAQVLGVSVNEETKSAIAVVKNDDLRVAIGKRGINVTLAVELTKYKIDIKEEDDAIALGLNYESLELMNAKDKALVSSMRNQELQKLRAAKEELLSQQAQEEVEEEYLDEFDDEEVETKEEISVDANDSNEVEEKAVEETVVEEKTVEEPKIEYNPVRMQPSFSLSDFEKQIEEEKKKKVQPSKKKTAKVEKEEATPVKQADNRANYMPIYTPEEEAEFDDEDDDLSKYDDDRFEDYDDDSFYEID